MFKHATLMGLMVGIALAVPYVMQSKPDFFSGVMKRQQEKPAVVLSATPAKKPTPAPAMGGARVEIAMDERGHFQTDFKLNGRKIHAIIDTGATFIALNRSTASRIGVNVTASDMVNPVTTANGTTAAAAVVLSEVTIGKIRVRNVPALVLDDRALNGVLIGMSFLKELDRFTVEDQTMILQQ
jgi:aspartyl protease family protein